MIRVNLLKNRGGTYVGTVSTQIGDMPATTSTEISGSNDTKSNAIKIILMIMWAGGLFAYQKFNISNLEEQLAGARAKATDLNRQIQQHQAEADQAKRMQKDIQELKRRIKIIKGLSKTRLREIKAIDYIQNNIPNKLWLSSLTFKDNKMKLLGSSMTDDQLNRFLDALEQNKSYFQNVLLLKAVDESDGKMGTLKSFEISSDMGATD